MRKRGTPPPPHPTILCADPGRRCPTQPAPTSEPFVPRTPDRMPAEILDGNQIAAQIRAEVKARIEGLKRDRGLVPGLATVLVGEDPASQVYVNMKNKD